MNMNPKIIVSALLNLSNAFKKSMDQSNAILSMIFARMFPRNKLKGQARDHTL